MTTTTKEIMINQKYYVSVKKHRKAKNVLLVTYPKNIFHQPPLEEETFQYYIEDNSILVTKLSSKETKILQTNMIERRILVICDIFARAIKRGITADLIVAENKSRKLINLIEMPKHLKKEEKEIAKVFAAVLRKNKNFDHKYKDSYDQFINLVNIGGII